ncbi:diaminopimelate epimerase [Anaerovibrio lipolyticus]|uniref:diaminopimelate epimerase n=1 Tax=Anaerovibrio lipolyticus TaxID=82374 RepID=UPI0026F23F60|nr:diaminopimelate epimerase [Anaerovibrio lipolyticus]MBE6106564.1 diaminopimelate epimerase [Anaerovibrio lipolyticus]
MKFNFTKLQGTGNDFVLIDCLKEPELDYIGAAKALCDRHYGIGADGILLVLPSDKADICMRIINADGSEAEMCGNGIRCFARYVYEKGIVSKEEFTVETGAGLLVPKMILENGHVSQVQVDMGEPILEGDSIPVQGFGMNRVISESITVKDKEFKMTCVSMGNPHCVVFVEDAEGFPIYEYGPLFESHEKFPRKTNTEFVEVKDKSHLRMRVWERGAAVTLACGTGSCATLTAAVLNGLAERKAEIQLDGGRLLVEWADNNHLYMTGPAEEVFTGVADI